jgi:hypothetical protein
VAVPPLNENTPIFATPEPEIVTVVPIGSAAVGPAVSVKPGPMTPRVPQVPLMWKAPKSIVDADAAGAAMAAAITGTDQAAPFTMVRRVEFISLDSILLKGVPPMMMRRARAVPGSWLLVKSFHLTVSWHRCRFLRSKRYITTMLRGTKMSIYLESSVFSYPISSSFERLSRLDITPPDSRSVAPPSRAADINDPAILSLRASKGRWLFRTDQSPN